MQKTMLVMLTVCTVFAAAACDNKGSGGGGGKGIPAAAAATPPAAPAPTIAPVVEKTPEPAAPSTAPAQRVEIEISSVGNEMKFDKTALTVPTGAEVHLVMKANSTMDTMPHNWALVKPGTEAQVALEGLKKAPNDGFIVPGPDVYAYTPLALPGKTTEVTFTAPAPGKYPYICTVPGHYLFMKGVLTVTP